MSCLEFDNKMMEECYSEYEAFTKENLENGVIYYIIKSDTDVRVRVEFDVTIENGEEESSNTSMIRINDMYLD